MSLDLLHERLIQTNAGWYSLPGLLAALARGEVKGFPALRPHQRPAWHMFLVQLSVMGLDAVNVRALPQGEDGWRAALRALSLDFPGDEPWHLVGTDRSRPAFLQPADPGGLKWTDVATPDALDMVITSRNHDVKRGIARQAAAQDWIFALVSLQTMEGYGGGGGRLNGIARMNKGNSSRVLLGLAPGNKTSSNVDPSAWWRRDSERLLYDTAGRGGSGLLWVAPWPEGQMIDISSLHPLFIEVCRRLKLSQIGDRICASKSTSSLPRTSASDLKGNTGDPWAPVHLSEGKSLTLGDRDWTHGLLVDLLFSDTPEWAPPPLAIRHASEATAPMMLVAEAFSRGNSKTDGFKSRIVPVPMALVKKLFGAEPVEVAKGVLLDISAVTKGLSHSLRLVGSSGNAEKLANTMKNQSALNKLDSYSTPAREALRRQADALFFPELWARMSVTTDAGIAPLRLAFLETLSRVARDEFAGGLSAIPCASLMRPRAEARGRQALERGLARAMRDLKPEVVDVEI